MRVLLAVLGVATALIGGVFLLGNQGVVLRMVVGGVLLAAGLGLLIAARLRPKVEQRSVVQRVELSGDVRVQDLTCSACGARLDEGSVSVRAGAAFARCGHCGATAQLEEAPKW
jgi:hypothetical protein